MEERAGRTEALKTNALPKLVFISASGEKVLTEPFFFIVIVYCFIFPFIHSCINSNSTFPCFLSLSPQKGHINNMLCSFEADGRLKVSVYCLSALLPAVVSCPNPCRQKKPSSFSCVSVETLIAL